MMLQPYVFVVVSTELLTFTFKSFLLVSPWLVNEIFCLCQHVTKKPSARRVFSYFGPNDDIFSTWRRLTHAKKLPVYFGHKLAVSSVFLLPSRFFVPWSRLFVSCYLQFILSGRDLIMSSMIVALLHKSAMKLVQVLALRLLPPAN